MPARSSLKFAVMMLALLSLHALRASGHEGIEPPETRGVPLYILGWLARSAEARALPDTLGVENYRISPAAAATLDRIRESGSAGGGPKEQLDRLAAFDRALDEILRYDETIELECTASELRVVQNPRRFRLVDGVPRLVPIIVRNPSNRPVSLEWSVDPDSSGSKTSATAGGPAPAGAERVPAHGLKRFFAPLTSTTGQRKASLRFATPGARLTVTAPAEVTASGSVTVRVMDETSSSTPTRLYATGSDGLAYFPDAALKRITWRGQRYAYVPGKFTIRLPEGPAKLEFLRGLEYRVNAQEVAVPRDTSRELSVRLERTSDLPSQGWFCGDGHIHMRYGGTLKMTPEQAILMLQAEDVNVGNMVVANMRGDDVQDQEYFEGRPNRLSRPLHVMRWNEEYRNNLMGHLILYGLERLTDPIYSGFPRTPHSGDFPLNADIGESVMKQGGFVTGPHALRGRYEHVIDVVLGKMDGIETMGYGVLWPNGERILHALWNSGFRTVATAGTDSFLNAVRSDPLGGARCCAKVDGKFSYDSWLDAVRAGRTFVTNSPILFLSVNGEGPGAAIHLARDGGGKGRVAVKATASSRWPLSELLVYFDGDVVGRSLAKGGADRELVFEQTLEIPHSGWISARVTGPHNRYVFGGRFDKAGLQAALTSPVWISLDHEKMPPSQDAAQLLAWVDAFILQVETQGRFESEGQRQHMREVYGEARRRIVRMVEDYRKSIAAK